MTISPVDIKKLWGLAAGRCSKPGCGSACIEFLAAGTAVVIGEMAHVIAHSVDGPRADGGGGGGDDTYENLILLCPTHHTLIDKAPDDFPVETLQAWKRDHEDRVRKAFEVPVYASRAELFAAIQRLLIETKAVWRTYGPESEAAKSNPLSNLMEVWTLRKITEIIPKNRMACNLIRANGALLTADEYDVSSSFIEHAEGFEQSCYDRRENVPRFPREFEEMVAENG